MRPLDVRTPAGGAGVAEGVSKHESPDSAQPDGERKLLATLAARLALQGVELHELAGGGFVAIGVGTYARLGDLGAVKRYAAAMESRA